MDFGFKLELNQDLTLDLTFAYSNIIIFLDGGSWLVSTDYTSNAGGLASSALPSTDVRYSNSGWKDDDSTLSMLGSIFFQLI